MENQFIHLSKVKTKKNPINSTNILCIVVLILVLLYLIHRYNSKENKKQQEKLLAEQQEQKYTPQCKKSSVERFHETIKALPINKFHTNYPVPPTNFHKYTFCGNNEKCNPGHTCTNKLYGAMFPPVCTCNI